MKANEEKVVVRVLNLPGRCKNGVIGLLKVEYHDICDICIPVPRRRPLALLFNEALADKDREKVRLEELVKSKS